MLLIAIKIITDIIIPLITISLFCYLYQNKELMIEFYKRIGILKIHYFISEKIHYLISLKDFIKDELHDVVKRHDGFYNESDRELFDIKFFIENSKYEDIEIVKDNDIKEIYFICYGEILHFHDVDQQCCKLKYR